jgi:diaminohydroxyphosphoribosylaminopyrimidine deaminase/5-amino-6-(5-phosphoribosylamino)uracil reductase
MVGALVVKNGRIIGRGYHEKAGLAHAEIIALDEAGKNAKDASLYVTLEPCAHFGKTPHCVDRITRSRVKEVIVGMSDPNPLNNGRGIQILKQNKIKVKVGFLEDKLKRQNEAFIKYITKRIPFVTVKVGQSLDGKIATRTGDSKWITSDKSRAYVRRLRQNYDAIMVGVNTILRDNPMLDAWFSEKQPIKIVVDSQLSIHQDANIFSGKSPVIIVTLPISPGQETENRKILAAKARILEVKEKAGQINLKGMMRKLAQLEITNILVEGGGTLIGTLFDEGFIDKIMFFVSPKIIGGKEAISSVMGKGVSRVDKAVKLKEVKFRRIDEDILVEGYV